MIVLWEPQINNEFTRYLFRALCWALHPQTENEDDPNFMVFVEGPNYLDWLIIKNQTTVYFIEYGLWLNLSLFFF